MQNGVKGVILKNKGNNKGTMLEFTTGAEIIARAAVDAGCDFFAGYPITPASGILSAMMKMLPASGGIAIQGEDELASIGYCLGASSAGRKVMTATSGPGISLYSENIGFAQMAELPIVIVNVQRMGPATGGATTNAEGDVEFVRWVTSGGYPFIAFCPTNLEESYRLTCEAFNWAERLRTPVFLLTCKDLVMNMDTADVNGYKRPSVIARSPFVADDEAISFKPYAYSALSDVPPFAPIGGDILTRINTSVHDQNGMLTKKPEVCDKALRHLNEKIMAHAGELEYVSTDLEKGADTVIVAYGAAARTARETIAMARSSGKKMSLVIVHSLWPVPEAALKKAVGAHKKIIVPEHNLGQYVLEIKRLFPDKDVKSVTKIDGTLITPEEVTEYSRF
ncbi:MAG: pyruvate flavodoxin/ferredoxin oxidoreductase [Deltaproteobacteria bacterium]|nr:pyruvate flavodoxin/ferredoxin oxidoreductase [Deltaproteobacteria bacterium]